MLLNINHYTVSNIPMINTSRIKKLVLSTVVALSVIGTGLVAADPVQQDLRWTNPSQTVDGSELMNLAKVTAYVSLLSNTHVDYDPGDVATVEFIQTVAGAQGSGSVMFNIDNKTTTYTVVTATNTDDEESVYSDREITRLWSWTAVGTTPMKIIDLQEEGHTVICIVPEGWTCNVL